MDFSENKKTCFHYIRKGDCWLTSDDRIARLGPGDLLYVEAGLDQLNAEYMSQQPGSNVVVDKLTEILLVELIRINFGRSEKTGFMKSPTRSVMNRTWHSPRRLSDCLE